MWDINIYYENLFYLRESERVCNEMCFFINWLVLILICEVNVYC